MTLSMKELRHPGERRLRPVMMTVALAIWSFTVWLSYPDLRLLAAIVGIFLAFSMLGRTLFVARLRGNSVRVGPHQYPDINRMVEEGSRRLGLPTAPEVYVVQESVMNALASRFLRSRLVVLNSSLVEALLAEGQPAQLMMVVGHELGHLRAGHLSSLIGTNVLVPFLWQYWRRVCELTADRAGCALAGDRAAARMGLLKLVAGRALAGQTNLEAYFRQAEENRASLLMRFAKLFSSYPYFTERVVQADSFALRSSHVTAAGSAPAESRVR